MMNMLRWLLVLPLGVGGVLIGLAFAAFLCALSAGAIATRMTFARERRAI
jgi:hypothetical protein